MKLFYFMFLCFFCFFVKAENVLETSDNTNSVLKSDVQIDNKISKKEFPTVLVNSPEVCSGPHCFYKNKHNVAPNAVPTVVGVVVNNSSFDECCNKVVDKNVVCVEICAPKCPCKNEVRSSKDGTRVVYDYGKYEAVVSSKDNKVEVKYRKRLLNR